MSSDSTSIQQAQGSSRTVSQPYRHKSAPSHVRQKQRQKGIWVQNLTLIGFKPEEIEIKTKSRGVAVHAKSTEESSDGTVYLKEIRRYFTLPDDVRASDIKCILSEDGRLTLKAPVRYHSQQAIHGTSLNLQLHVSKRLRTESISEDSLDRIEMTNKHIE